MLEMLGPDLLKPLPNSRAVGNVIYYDDLIQGSDEWLAARCGILTASEMKHIVTPAMKPAKNEKTRTHLYNLLAQRITGYVEPSYISDDMLRGMTDEMDALILYAQHYHPLQNIGFMTNSKWGFTLGYSPDGLVGDDGLVECKSRLQKYQVQTIVEHVCGNELPPDDFMIQLQTGLLVSERKWIDFISYCGGLEMATLRVYPDPDMQAGILAAAEAFHAEMSEKRAIYDAASKSDTRLIPTVRKVIQEMHT